MTVVLVAQCLVCGKVANLIILIQHMKINQLISQEIVHLLNPLHLLIILVMMMENMYLRNMHWNKRKPIIHQQYRLNDIISDHQSREKLKVLIFHHLRGLVVIKVNILKRTQKQNGRGGQDGNGDGNRSRGHDSGGRNHGGHTRGGSGGHARGGSSGHDNGGSGGRRGKGCGKHNGSVQDRDSPVCKQKSKATKLDPLDKLPHSAISIEMKELANIKHADFCPLREPGIYIPGDMDVSALSLFELFFDDVVLKRLLDSTLEYAELKKAEKCKRYHLFMRQKLTTAELKAYLGALLRLGIHSVRNHRKAWSTARAQVLIRLRDLLTCQRFELIGTFLHVVTKQEEEEVKEDRLRKLLPSINYIKNKCFEFYQPVQQLAVDERMVKSKARSHLIQFMRNKPVKWGFKLWVIADPSGYTLDFNVYTGKDTNGKSNHGLSYDVVMKLVAPFLFQGYHLYIDKPKVVG